MFTFAHMHLHVNTQCILVQRRAHTSICIVCIDDNIHKYTYALISIDVKTHTGTQAWRTCGCDTWSHHTTLFDSTKSCNIAWGGVSEVQILLTELEIKIPSSPKLLSRRSTSRAALVGLCRKKSEPPVCNPFQERLFHLTEILWALLHP